MGRAASRSPTGLNSSSRSRVERDSNRRHRRHCHRQCDADTGNAITSIRVDLGDGSVGTLTGQVGQVQHVYTAPGQYIVTAVATDSSGATGSASTVIIVGNRAQLAVSVTAPSPAPTGRYTRDIYPECDTRYRFRHRENGR